MKPEQNKSYIFKQIGTSFPDVRKGIVVDLTKTTIKIKWEDKTEYREEISTFMNKWKIIEEIEEHSEIY